MIRRFVVSQELQQFLQGVDSRALNNVIWNRSFTADPTALLPVSGKSVRRSLLFDKISLTDEATPTEQYNCFILNLDGTDENSATMPRVI